MSCGNGSGSPRSIGVDIVVDTTSRLGRCAPKPDTCRRTSPRSPWLNATRTHLSLDKDAPLGRHCRCAHSVRAASSLRADMIFGSACKPLGSLAVAHKGAPATPFRPGSLKPESSRTKIIVGRAISSEFNGLQAPRCTSISASDRLLQLASY
jgi:hypothetical protein